jgi:hypothetical protein
MRHWRRAGFTGLGVAALTLAALMSDVAPRAGAQGAASARGGQDLHGHYDEPPRSPEARIATSRDRRIFAADRGHERFQVFGEDGKFLDMFQTRESRWPAGVRSQPY